MSLLELQSFEPDVVAGYPSHKGGGSGLSIAACRNKGGSNLSLALCKGIK